MACNECGKKATRPPETPKRVIGWQAWYTNGRVFRSCDTTWADLPDDGMLGVVLCESTVAPDGHHTRQILSSYDAYFLAEGVFGGNNDPVAETGRRYPGAAIKRGKWTTLEEMQAVAHAMLAERFTWGIDNKQESTSGR